MNIISKDQLCKYVTYDPETGVFYHKVRSIDMFSSERNMKKWNTRYALKIAGRKRTHKNGKSYWYITINDKEYLAHRMVWLYVYGELPSGHIDHIDGNGVNNTIRNLRDVDALTNAKNSRLYKTSKTGVNGVTIHSQNGKYVSKICANNKTYSLGCYHDFFEACCARKSAERKFKFHINNSSVRPL